MEDLALEQYRGLAEFRYQIRRFLHFSETLVRDAGLEPAQHQLLLAIHGLPTGLTASVGVIAERLQVQHHSAVELIDRAAAQGLIERQRSSPDRRQVLVALTPKGEQVLQELSRLHWAELQTTGPELAGALASIAAAGAVADANVHARVDVQVLAGLREKAAAGAVGSATSSAVTLSEPETDAIA